MVATVEVCETELPERMAARLGPRPESPARLVALGVESDRFVEIVDLERHAAEQIRQACQVQLVAGSLGVLEQTAILLERALVVAASQGGVSEVIERQRDQISRVLSARQLEALTEMTRGVLVFAVPFEIPAGEREALRQQTRIAGVPSETPGFGRVAHGVDDRPVHATRCFTAQRMAAGLAGRVADLGGDRERRIDGREDLGDLVA